MITILVLAWGGYEWLAGPLEKALRREWIDTPPIRVTDWNVKHPSNFSRLLRGELMKLRSPVVYLTPVDTFPLGPMEKMESMVRYIVQAANVVRLGVAHEDSLAAHGKPADWWEGVALENCADWQHCSGSGGLLMDAALWNLAHLTNLLPNAWTMAEVESRGSDRMREERPDLTSLGAVPGLFHTVKLVDASSPRTISRLDQLHPEDRAAVMEAKPDNWGIS